MATSSVPKKLVNNLTRSCARKKDLPDLSTSVLEPAECGGVSDLLERVRGPVLELNDLWRLMDEVWDEMGLDNERPDWERIGDYYSHPVWLLNGLFAQTDPVSRYHREAWRDWLRSEVSESSHSKRVVDYGGGFGVLAALLAEDPQLNIDIVEPHPPPPAIRRSEQVANVQFVPVLGGPYDYGFCSDVLEHVPDPVGSLMELGAAMKPGGKLMIANNFFPVIKCHLPRTFHLRYSFQFFARLVGFRSNGQLSCGHGELFERLPRRAAVPGIIRLMEFFSQNIFRARNQLSHLRRLAKSRP
jgi:SAM-dependent methyltransferase